ncbi:MAG: hypothetical protein B6D77_06240 [gamma proteobacterium symbiont of Ctena orbiculata]|nr:MAG: hypothetical protein B6D77_06240 [gamma proteobacterium symbiont of Ctena orbiculata]PVV25309.1 MAG: hypothetical protein B6D78_00500 [gamma proteobacterium symbiont of Ctena orbiculata]
MKRFSINWLLLGILSLTLLLTGCGGGGSSSEADSGESGKLVIGLTDAPGDFSTYSVDVISLTLTKMNGAVVETLPMNTRIDFAQYTDMTEFLTAASVPSGVYVKAEMLVDYSNAEIWVEDENGNLVQVPVGNILNEAGETLTQLDLSVHLEGRQSLRIVPGVPAHLTLDFDLNTSNQVDLSGAEPVLTVQPILLADLELDRPKIHRVRGPLADVDTGGNHFDINIRPFHHRFEHQHRFGDLQVNVLDETVYEIDGATFQGEAGLAALDAMPIFTATVAIGDLRRVNGRFMFQATEVYAGSSVAGGDLDAVKGNVIVRSGDQLTVRGATLMRTDGSVIFRDTITIHLDTETMVSKQLSTGAHEISEISVGQKVMVFGNLDAGESSLDADRLRMLTTVLNSTRVGEGDALVVDLMKIDGRPVSVFDFSGTGTTEATDADPQNYEVEHGALDISQIAIDAPLRVAGFVTPFATAPADFTARTLVDLTEVPAVMTVSYETGSGNAFSAISADGLTLDLTDAGRFHHLGRAGVVVDLLELGVEPVIVPHADDDGTFWIEESGTLQLHTSFASFAADLEARIDAGGLVKKVLSSGDYVDQSGVLTSRMVSVKLL